MASCSFCNRDVIDRQCFYEGEHLLALIDYRPITEGHCLVIPKRHISCFEELTAEEWKEVGEVINRVHRAVSHVFGKADYLILQKNGKNIGQTVPHVHFHYVRQDGSLQIFWFLRFFLSWMLSALSPNRQEALRSQLAQACTDTEIVD